MRIFEYVCTERFQSYFKIILFGTTPICNYDHVIAKNIVLGINEMGHEWINPVGISNINYALFLEDNI